MDPSFETIVYEEREGVAWVTFSRPEALNAFDETMSGELLAVCERVRDSDEVRAVVLRGEGQAFMAGADISMLERWSALSEPQLAALLGGMFSPTLLEQLPQPVIAAVDGYALGMGCEIALACDFRIVTSRSELGLPEITLGLMPGAGGTQRLPRLVGRTRAADVVLTGRRISAEEAHDWGLANAVVPPEELAPAAEKLVGRLVNLSPLALRRAKQALVASAAGLETGLEEELHLFVASVGSDDAKEGTKAFLEKRRPSFTGR